MEAPHQLHQLHQPSLLFHCQSSQQPGSDPVLDLGYFSAASSLSPTSSVDSFSFSPEAAPLNGWTFSSPATSLLSPERPPQARRSRTRGSRSRYPGRKRETASEREKLRMRDLTKALHHLRTYLPPSVAPPGQALTKIQTLRFTIHYVAHLWAQLGLSEEVLRQRWAFTGQDLRLDQVCSQQGPGGHAQQRPLQAHYQVCSNSTSGLNWFPQQTCGPPRLL